MIRTSIVAAAAAAALCAALPSAASAGTGTAEFFASIRAAGTIIGGSGVTSSTKVGTGRYEVVFPRAVSTCVYLVTPLSGSAHKAVARVTSSDLTRVLVNTFVNSSTAQDIGFNILVKCQD